MKTLFAKVIRGPIGAVLRWIKRTVKIGLRWINRRETILYAFYDLQVCPATFDIVTFLVVAEAERIRSGCNRMHVVIAPGPKEGFRQDNAPYAAEEKRWRLANILVPSCWLLPSCKSVTVCATRNEARKFCHLWTGHVFPSDYTIKRPIPVYVFSDVINIHERKESLPSLESTSEARRRVSEWVRINGCGRPIVALTLRECAYETDRNSRIEDWARFAGWLKTEGFLPVLVRDNAAAFQPLPSAFNDVTVFGEVLWNLDLRMAFYETSYLNMMVANGPGTLCFFNQNVRFLMFKLQCETSGATSEAHLRSIGLIPGRQPPVFSKYQRLVWDEDTHDALKSAFEDMRETIDGASAGDEGRSG